MSIGDFSHLPHGVPVKNVREFSRMEQRNQGENHSKSIFWRFLDSIRYIFTGPLFSSGLVDEGDGFITCQPGLGGRIHECIFYGCPTEETMPEAEAQKIKDAVKAARILQGVPS